MLIEIEQLLAQKKSVSDIARHLGIDRKTVRKYRELPGDRRAVASVAPPAQAQHEAGPLWPLTTAD